MEIKQLGQTGISISALGIGGLPLSLSGRPPESQAIEAIHRALDLGITFINTADSYCTDESEKHHNERLIAKALHHYHGDTSKVVVATKGGFTRPDGGWLPNGNPAHLRQTIQASFEALGGNKPIDLWLYHTPDPNYSLEESLAPAQEAVDKGFIRFVGVSNVSLKQLKRSRQLVEIVAVENLYNPWYRNNEFDGVLEYCKREKLTFFPWGPLGGIGGKFSTSNIDKLTEFNALAKEKGVSVYCIILAWLRAKSTAIVPIPGLMKSSDIEDSVKSLTIKLSNEDIKRLDRSVSTSQLNRVKQWVKRLAYSFS